jgi:hypothetical protein
MRNKLRFVALLAALSVLAGRGLIMPPKAEAGPTSPLACGNLLNDCMEMGEDEDVCYAEYDACNAL